jgi:hypothetical protein
MAANCDRYAASIFDPRRPEYLVRTETGVDLRLDRGLQVLREHDLAAAANAVAERAQTVGRGRAVASKAAAVATGCRLAALVQRADKVPARCSSAFEVF